VGNTAARVYAGGRKQKTDHGSFFISSQQTDMKLISQKEQDDQQAATVRGGLQYGAAGLATSVGASVAAQRFFPAYRNLTLPLKAFGCTAVTVFTLIVGADRAGAAHEAARYDPGKINQESIMEKKLNLGRNDPRRSKQESDYSQLSRTDAAIEYFKDHRYQTVFGAWAASMVGSFALIARSPLSTAQKLVQARMYAQGLTVAVLLASAGLSSLPTAASSGDDSEAKRFTQEDQMYKWKKGSPHEQAKKHAAEEAAAHRQH